MKNMGEDEQKRNMFSDEQDEFGGLESLRLDDGFS